MPNPTDLNVDVAKDLEIFKQLVNRIVPRIEGREASALLDIRTNYRQLALRTGYLLEGPSPLPPFQPPILRKD